MPRNKLARCDCPECSASRGLWNWLQASPELWSSALGFILMVAVVISVCLYYWQASDLLLAPSLGVRP